jgi:hypothetical protein
MWAKRLEVWGWVCIGDLGLSAAFLLCFVLGFSFFQLVFSVQIPRNAVYGVGVLYVAWRGMGWHSVA